MVVVVEVVPGGRVVRVGGPVRVSELLSVLGFVCGEAVVLVGGRPVPEAAVIPDGSRVTVVRVLSGGGA